MNRRQFLVSSSFAVAAGALRQVPLAGQGQQPPTPTSFKELRNGAGIFMGRGGTIGYSATPNALVVIDAQFPETAKVCLEGLKQRSSRTIDALINTHHHGDHTSGNGVFKPATKMIVAQRNVPDLQRKQAQQAQGGSNAADQVYADTTFTSIWRQEFGSETVRARYFGSAHTGGDSVVVFENANVAHMGDLVFNHRHPRIDRPGGGSIRGWIGVLDKAVTSLGTDTIYIFGHAAEGFETTGRREDVLLFRDYLTKAVEHVEQGIKAGQSKAQITGIQALPGFEKFVGTGNLTLASVLEVTYDELSTT